MPYWEMLGRVVVARESESVSDRITQYLTYSGIDATVSYEQDQDLYVVSVPKDQEETTRKLMNLFRENGLPHAKEDSHLDGFLMHSPIFVRAEDKFKDTTSSAVAFIVAGSFVFILAVINCTLAALEYNDDTYQTCLIQLGFGSTFLFFGFYTLHKANAIKAKIEEENAFITQVIEWCVSTYPSIQLDNSILAAEGNQPLSMEERYFRRKELIRCYISREYDIQDIAYLEYLTEETYISIFEKQKLGQKS